jgi:hypothetical protein
MDLDLDDYKEGSLFLEWQNIVLETAGILVVSSTTLSLL